MIIISILQIKKQGQVRKRKLKEIAQALTVIKLWNWDVIPGSVSLENFPSAMILKSVYTHLYFF